MNEEVLGGGNSSSVSRLGDTVLRAAGPWTPRVHELLRTLRAAGISEVPEPLGIDGAGREVLSWVTGVVGHYPLPDWIWSAEVLRESAELLRRVHDASVPLASLSAESATVQSDGWQLPSHRPVEVICHNDVAPYNLTFVAGHVAGLIDFDMASPGPRSWDLAYLAYRLVPFVADAGVGAPARGLRLERLSSLLSAYEAGGEGSGFGLTAERILAAMADRLLELAELTEHRARETGRRELHEHAAMYRSDSSHVRALAASATS